MNHKKLLALLLALCMVLSLLPAVAQADEQAYYTLDGTITGGTNGYATESEITQGNLTWMVTGNTTMSPWRIGGKSISDVDRPIYSTAAMNETITKVEVEIGAASSITVNDFCLIVASDADFSQIIEEKSQDFSANSKITFTPDNGKEWTNAYYKFVFNVTVSGTSNKYILFKAARFYSEGSGGETPTPTPDATPTSEPTPTPEPTYTDMKLKRVPANGDTVVIYYPTASKVMTGTDYLYNNKKHELVAKDATLTDNVLAVPDEAVRLTVSVTDGKYTFATADGKYLMADGTNVQLVDEQGTNTLFQLETAAAGTDNYYIKCDTATYNDKAQYIEYYSGYFTVYGMGTNTAIYTFQFFSEDGEGPTPAGTYTVSFDANGGSGTMEDVTDATSPYTLPECTFTAPEGMEFDCWKIEGDDTSYKAGASVTLTGDVTFYAQWKDLPTYTDMVKKTTIEDGDKVVIFNPDGGVVMTDADYIYNNSKHELEPAAAALTDEVLSVPSTAVVLTVVTAPSEDGETVLYSFKTQDNKYLYVDSSDVKFVDAAGDNTLFVLEDATDGYYIRCNTAAFNGNAQYLQYYHEYFTVYGMNASNPERYLMNFYAEEQTAIEDGFYLIGPDWTVGAINPANAFGENMEVGGEMLLAATLTEGDQIKVVKVENGAITAWYPDGIDTQYTVDAAHAGDVTIYFRETYNNDWAAFGGYFYIAADYKITCVQGEHGLISTAASRASAGTTVTVHVEAEEDYELDTLTVMCGETEIAVTKVNDGMYTFVMPAGDVTVTATFAIPAAEPFFKTQSITLDGLIGVNFNMELPEISGVDYSTSYMTFSVEHGECTERVDYSASRARSSQVKGFACYVNAVQMAEPITATFHYTQNGTEKTVQKTYSVMDYIAAYEENKDKFDETSRALVEALADYGHHVQIFLSEQRGWTLGTDYAEMTAVYTENYSADAVNSVKSAVEAYALTKTLNADTEKITYSLILDSAIEIRVFFKMTSGYSGSFEAGAPYTATKVGERYQVSVLNIPAHQLSNMYTVSVTTDAGAAGITVSALSYVRSMLNAYTSTSAQNAAAAIYAYSQAADAYKAAH